MTKTNKIDAEIPQAVEDALRQQILDMYTQFPWLVRFNIDERKRLVKMGHRYVDFVDKALINAQSKGQYLTNPITLDAWVRDVSLRNSLSRIYNEWRTAGESLRDTLLLVESESYQTARIFYKAVKAFASEGDSVAEQIERELSKYHKKKPADDEEVPEEPEASEPSD